ncbi:MAG: hypothetical protein CSA05_01190 [Bacteroidia bacterium]|nr:MAG: hypothetical protein CSA05_01190 [Bacteroidia bacterium]
MSRKPLKFLKKKLSEKTLQLDNRVIIFLFFLLISTIFWFLNALGKEYTTNIVFPVVYENFPENKILVSELPDEISLKVSSFGFTILKETQTFGSSPITIDVGAIALNRKEKLDSTKYYVLSNTMIRDIEQQFSSDFKILEISPDSLYFQFEEIFSKKIPVKNNINLKFEKQYVQKGKIQISPDSIIISGAASLIETIDSILTKPKTIENVNARITKKIALQEIEGTILSDQEVVVDIPVERYTEEKFRLPIQVTNLPDSLRLKLFPSYVNVSYLVAFNDYEVIDKKAFKAIVDYDNLQQKQNNKLRVKIVNFPENIISYSWYPRSVEYIIEK